MLKKVKKIVALMMATMALSTLFVTTAFAQENDVEVIEEAKILEEKEQCKARNSFCVSASGEYQVKHKQHPKVGKGTLGCCYLGVPGMGNS